MKNILKEAAKIYNSNGYKRTTEPEKIYCMAWLYKNYPSLCPDVAIDLLGVSRWTFWRAIRNEINPKNNFHLKDQPF